MKNELMAMAGMSKTLLTLDIILPELTAFTNMCRGDLLIDGEFNSLEILRFGLRYKLWTVVPGYSAVVPPVPAAVADPVRGLGFF